jgi:mono/diheme cytochrome c family protein
LKGRITPPDSKTDAASAERASSGADQGRKIFADSCSACHGAAGEGGHGPSLTSVRDAEKIAQMVRRGGGQMPAFDSKLSESEIQAVASYVRETIVK